MRYAVTIRYEADYDSELDAGHQATAITELMRMYLPPRATISVEGEPAVSPTGEEIMKAYGL